MKKLLVILGITIILLCAFAYLSLTSHEIVVLGVLGDYTSSNSTAPIEAYRAIELAVAELNATTYKYELVRLNLINYGDVESLRKDIKKMKVDILIGPSTSGQFLKVKDMLEAIDLPVFLIAVSTDVIHDKKDNLFRLTDTLQIQVNSLVIACKSYIGLKNIQVFYTEKNSAFSKVLATDLSNAINGYGGTAKHSVIGNLSKESVQHMLQKKYDADGFVIIAGPGDAGIIAGLVSENNPGIPMLMPNWANSERTKEYAGAVKNKIYILSTAQPTRESDYNDFKNKIKSITNLSLTPFSYFGYEVTYFIDYVLDQVDSTALTDIQGFIHNIDIYKGNFNDFTFNHSGDGARGYSLAMIHNNQFILIERILE